ncbi:MAG: hypothetical protein GYA20_07440 [Chloroflexi bacterium]|nr:hypothetical protein [Chloroflexota bacterium]
MSDDNDFAFDLEGLIDVLVGAGLNPKEPHDMRLFSNELTAEPGAGIAEAAKRAGERKRRVASGSGFDQLNDYFQALKKSVPRSPDSDEIPQSEETGLQTLSRALRGLRERSSK